MGFILFVLFIVCCLYNGLQVIKAINGKRFEKPGILFFFACFIDGWNWAKTKF